MKIRWLIIFFVFLTFLLSVGGVSAQDMDNMSEISSDIVSVDDDVSGAVLMDTLHANNQDTNLYSNDEDFTKDNNDSLFNSNNNQTDELLCSQSTTLPDSINNDEIGYLKANDSDIVIGDNFVPVVYDRPVIVNPDFEDAGNPVGWNHSSVSIYSLKTYAKNGNKYLSLSDGGFISQRINLDTVDFISFWYMSDKRNSKVEVLFDDKSFLEYTVQNVGMGKWGMVLLNVSNYSGFHTLKLLQKGSQGYVDYFNIIHNSNILVNFTLTDYCLVGDNLTLSFVDLSYGLIGGWLWDFGDGKTSSSQNVTHSFKTGHYTITLKVFNDNTTKYAYYTVPISFPTIERTGQEYGSVQEAIDNALDGDVINVKYNMFYSEFVEDLVIGKSIILNFSNCSLINSSISVVDGADVVINEICLDNVSLHVMDDSHLTFARLSSENIVFTDCNMIFSDTCFNGTFITLNNSNVTFKNCNISNGGIIAWNSSLMVSDCVFTNCSESIVQHGGESVIAGNIFHDNCIGVDIVSGCSDLSFNTFYYNRAGLLFNSSNVTYDNNWWGSNNPSYVYNSILSDCDVCQVDGIENPLTSWLVLNITQSDVLDYKYYIAGITYYNLTFDLTHNNLGEDTSKKGFIKMLTINVKNIEGYVYYERHSYYGNIKKVLTNVVSQDASIINGIGHCMFSLGYLTSDFTILNLTILNNTYSVFLKNNSDSPNISYVTPFTVFNDTLTVEMDCMGGGAVIFYTLDGTNPGYSPTRLVYTEPLIVNESCTIHYCVIDKWGNFQKVLLDTIRHYGSHYDLASFVRQDVYVVLKPESSANIYYSIDGNKIIDTGTNAFDGMIHYYHPFIIHGTAEINAYGENYYNDYAEVYFANQALYMYCYGYDFSVNYLKNISFNNSDAIWSQYQGNINNTGVSNYSGPVSNQSSWTNYDIISSGSAVVDSKGRIVVGGNDGYLYYLNKMGQVIWRFGTTSRIICTPTIGADGNIYFSNWMNSSVYCISSEGQLLWKYNLGDYNTGTSPVFGLDNRLYVLTSNGVNSNMYVFKDGILLGNHTIPFISGSTPIVSSDGLLYLMSGEHEFVVLNFDGSLKQASFIDSGATIPSHYYYMDKQQDTQMSASMGDDGMIYVLNYPRSTNYNSLSSYYPNGTLKWSLDAEKVFGTPTYYNGTVYVNGLDKIIAVNASNGKIIWNKAVSGIGLTASSPLVSGNGILYVVNNNVIYAFDLNGELVWSPSGYIVPSGAMVYTCNYTGNLSWQYTISGGKYGNPISYSSPTLTAEGTLIVTTNQGIYAFRDIAADFTYEHVDGTETTIEFTDLSTKGNNRYYWMFGDGNISREQNPIHDYSSPGIYRVVLLVEYNGTIDLMRNKTIEVVYYDITPPSNVTCYIDNAPTNGGIYNQTQIITLNATDKYGNVTIYYTVDASNPVNSSTRRTYTQPFDIEVDTILNVVAQDSAGNYGNVTALNFTITDAVKVNTTLIDEIQALLDNAEPGSKIFFDYPIINGANFTVNKPLNIISNINTQLIGNNNQPVFTFTNNASGSILNGFSMNNKDHEGILINGASDVSIRNCIVNVTGSSGINIIKSSNVQVKDTSVSNALDGIIVNQSAKTQLDNVKVTESYNNGIWIYQSQNTIVSNSFLENNGKDWYNSKANSILIDDSKDTRIINNVVNYGFFGIHLYHSTDGVVIDNNTIYETSGDAILLSNRYSNVNITHNLINGCYNGIDFMGYSENVTIKQNTIKLLHDHENDLFSFVLAPLIEEMAGYVYETYFPTDQFYNHRANGIQVSYPASNFDEGNTIIMDNVVIRLGHRSWEARKYQHYINAGCDSYGYNLMDGSNSYDLNNFGGATSYSEGKVDIVLDRIGDATFRLRLINRLDNHYLSEIPEFDVIFRAGGFTQTVKFINDSAIATFDVSMAVSDIEAIISGEIRKSAHFDIPITEGYSSTNKAYDPGFERGEAYNNPDPVIPKIPPEEDDYKSDYNPVVPEEPIVPEPEVPDTGEGTGNGSGNGNGTGNGLFDGNGNGSAFGNGDGTHGSGKTNVNGREGQTVDNLNELAESFVGNMNPVGVEAAKEGNDINIEGESSGGEGETPKAYEVTKQINVENVNEYTAVFIVLLALLAVVAGYVKKRYYEGGEI